MVTRVVAEFDSPEKADIALERIMSGVRGVYSANVVHRRGGAARAEMPLQAVDSVSGAAQDNGGDERRSTLYIVCDGSRSDDIYSLIMTMGGINMA